jgi:colanic acid biosynthesis protein WcaH
VNAISDIFRKSIKKLDASTFQTVVFSTPLVSLDLMLIRGSAEILLGLRVNQPAQDWWFVPGGRIYKNERIHDALIRIAETELGLGSALLSRQLSSQFLGVFEQFYDDCFSGAKGVTTHYVSMPYILPVQADFSMPEGDDQHKMLRWWPISEALASPDVHRYCKDYLMQLKNGP